MSSFEETMMGLSPGCYIPSFVEIDLSVPEKIFDRFLPYRGVWRPSWSCVTIYGNGGHLGHVTSIISDFHFLVPESFHAKFGSDRHSSF